MACKKSELVSAINSFGSARATGNHNLIGFAVSLIGQLVETLEFAPETTPVETNEIDVVD